MICEHPTWTVTVVIHTHRHLPNMPGWCCQRGVEPLPPYPSGTVTEVAYCNHCHQEIWKHPRPGDQP